MAKRRNKPVLESIDLAYDGLTMNEIKRAAIITAVNHNDGNRTVAARQLGLSLRGVTGLLKEYKKDGYYIEPSRQVT